MRTWVIASVVLVLGSAGGGASPQPSVSRPSRLFKDSRQSLAIARAQGRREVVLLVATRTGSAAAVAQEVERLGGNVRARKDEVGYLRVRVPIDRVTELAGHAAIESIAMDRDETYPGRLLPGDGDLSAVTAESPASGSAWLTSGPAGPPAQAAQKGEQWPPVWGDYPLRNHYSPLADLDAKGLLEKHPTYDGRGVGIAVLDGNLDLLLPEFQTAYTVDGKSVPKIADFLNAMDPRDDGDAVPQWVNMREEVNAEGATLNFQGKTFTPPRPGRYRIGFFSERRFNDPSNGAYIDQDIDRNGNPKGDDGLFGVLWDEQSNDVWVDANRNLSFADEKAMTDYRVRGDIGVFGKDDPATPVRDSIGFAVQTDRANKFVSINVGIYQHATIILGSVTGNREPKGRIGGVAPGARIISIMHNGIAHAMLEAIIMAFEHPLVDLIVLEQHVGIATLPYLLADARHPISIVTERLIQKHKKLIFVPGSNSPGFAIVGEEGLAPSAVSVGGYQSSESYRLNAGFTTEDHDNLHWGALSHGPSGNGGLKPDLLAPSGQMSTDPGYRKGEVRRGLFQLPPGYTVDGGTSTATPMAAGAAALVVSAAKQAKVPVDAMKLKAALTGSARHIPRLGAHEQGNGLIQVGAAFALLQKLQSAPAVTITSRAPVKTTISHLLTPPNEGVGLFEREGWKAGDKGTRTIAFTRTDGPAEPMTFAVSWLGNDGTFSSAAAIDLPRGKAVDLPVAIAVKDAGVHTALLTLDHASVPGHAYRLLNTIVAPIRLDAAGKHTATTEVTVPRPGDRGVFVNVPPGVAALTLSASATDSTVRLSAISPGRDQVRACAFSTPPPTACAVAQPEPGVWEINASVNAEARDFDPTRELPLKAVPVKVTTALLGIDVAAASPPAALAAGSSADVALSLTNRFGAVTAGAVSIALGSGFETSRTIAAGEQHVFEVTVPKGATSLRARIGSVADKGADLDVYLLDCTVPEAKPPAAAPPEKEKGNKAPPTVPPICTPRAKAASAVADGEVEAADPAAGRWVVVVDAYHVPGGRTSYAYSDFVAHPRWGALSVSDAAERRDAGAAWKASAHLWSASLPEAPRALAGRVVVQSRDVRSATGSPITIGSLDLSFGTGRPTAPSGER